MSEIQTTPEAEAPTVDHAPSLGQVVHKIAWEINQQRMNPGEVAELRRLDPTNPGGSAFWKAIVFKVEPAGQLFAADGESRWALILRAIAELAQQDLPQRRLGIALAEANIGEDRVDRLLRCDLDTLPGTLRAITHQLASAAVKVNLEDLAWLVVTARGGTSSPEGGEAVRRKVARDYFRGLRKATEES